MWKRALPGLRNRQALADTGALGVSITNLLDTTGVGIIQFDRHRRLLDMNDRTRDLLRSGDSLFDKRGFLYAGTPEDNTRLQPLLKCSPPQVLYVNLVERRGTDFRVWPVAALILVAARRSGLVSIRPWRGTPSV